jgi:hypothetical protein
MKVARIIIGVVAVSFALAGCADSGTPIAASPSAPPPVVESPTPTPTPTSTPEPALPALLVAPDGVGYLTIGAPVPTDVAEPIVAWDAKACVEQNSSGKAEYDGAWYPAPGYGKYGTKGWAIFTNGKSGNVTGIWVFDHSMSTAAGIHPGSTETELLTAYPDLEVTTDNGFSRMYELRGASGHLVFEVPYDKKQWGETSESLKTVIWMTVEPIDGPVGSIGFIDFTECRG